ncbi:hypothetical protein ACFVIZ_14700 [Streptomyces anulatus]|uniref:hypothetical protein n=1 Tax=Streptomyces anulatus TaxID=1892 RepID=UPI003641CF4D
MSVDQTSWEAAVRHLYEDAYPYDATGPRRHKNWVLALTDDGCTLSNLSRFAESEAELRAMVRTILTRYGNSTRFHTNVNKPGHEIGTLDFTSSGWAYSPLSVYSEDYGLIAVSDTEVGMFWNFAAY